MKRYLCIHGHFYQPPRENPWLEALEVEDSARPYHDWNERVLKECYAPNAASRILDQHKRILKVTNNYRYISFNFGPTLFSWIKEYDPAVYQAILEADQQSLKEHNGHGNAIAQVYTHIIMPLASRCDKWIQIQWGIKDFQARFRRFPEGMWLPETAVDLETLELLAEAGIKFTLLAPHQALRMKKISGEGWMEVRGGTIDPTLPYRCYLKNGNYIDIFFYDGPISNSIAFENILQSGDLFIKRVLSGFSNERVWDQILSIATDGESYGHHYRFGDMALAYVLSHIGEHTVEIINYGEYLERYPPQFQVEIAENTSWSCAHGIERWRGDCGCNTGAHPQWNQAWRTPLRQSLNSLKDTLDTLFETHAQQFLKDPWDAFKGYINIILERSKQQQEEFFSQHQIQALEHSKKVKALKLLEMEKAVQLMFTSCGWFFDDLSGIETLQNLKYAARAIQLARSFSEEDIESPFMETLSLAKSNIPEKGTGKNIYQTEVLHLMVDIKNVLMHYAISSLFEEYKPKQKIYCYLAEVKDFQKGFNDGTGLAMGKTKITDQITQEVLEAQFAILHSDAQIFTTYIKEASFHNNFIKLVKYNFWKFNCNKLDMVKEDLQTNFQGYTLTLRDLFLDERRKISAIMTQHILEDLKKTYHRIYEEYKIIMDEFMGMDIPIPEGFKLAAEYSLAEDLRAGIEALIKGKEGNRKIQEILEQSKKWHLDLGTEIVKEAIRDSLEFTLKKLTKDPFEKRIVSTINTLLDINESLKLKVEIQEVQNLFYEFFHQSLPHYPQQQTQEKMQDFKTLGIRLNFSIE